MEIDPSRLRFGEWLATASGVLLLADMFLFKWYGGQQGAPDVGNGWHGLIHLRWLILVSALAGLGLGFLQASRRAPALPVSTSVIAMLLGLATVVWMAYRLFISVPPQQKPAAIIGFVLACGLTVGSFLSMRTEGIAEKDGPAEIELVELGTPSTAADS